MIGIQTWEGAREFFIYDRHDVLSEIPFVCSAGDRFAILQRDLAVSFGGRLFHPSVEPRGIGLAKPCLLLKLS